MTTMPNTAIELSDTVEIQRNASQESRPPRNMIRLISGDDRQGYYMQSLNLSPVRNGEEVFLRIRTLLGYQDNSWSTFIRKCGHMFAMQSLQVCTANIIWHDLEQQSIRVEVLVDTIEPSPFLTAGFRNSGRFQVMGELAETRKLWKAIVGTNNVNTDVGESSILKGLLVRYGIDRVLVAICSGVILSVSLCVGITVGFCYKKVQTGLAVATGTLAVLTAIEGLVVAFADVFL